MTFSEIPTPTAHLGSEVLFGEFVYGWFRESGECLYIGETRCGMARIVEHETIGKVEPVAPTDYFVFWSVPRNGNWQTKANRLKLEAQLTEHFKPTYSNV